MKKRIKQKYMVILLSLGIVLLISTLCLLLFTDKNVKSVKSERSEVKSEANTREEPEYIEVKSEVVSNDTIEKQVDSQKSDKTEDAFVFYRQYVMTSIL